MKKNIFKPLTLLAGIALLGIFSACTKNYGDPVTMNYAIDGAYTKLDISNAFDVIICDTVTEAVVTVPEKLHSKVKVQVKSGVLYIGYTSAIVINPGDATVLLPPNTMLKDLELSGASSFHGDLQGVSSEIEISGASDFFGNVTANSVTFEISGASDANCVVNTDEVEAEISGASNATLSGTCTSTMDIDVSGSSKLNATPFNTDAVTGEISGASDAYVTVCSRIAVDLSGSSSLTYGTSSPDCHPTYGCTTTGSSTVIPIY